MLDSLTGLAVRQVKARRLRALLTSFGIVLGVGMVYGVLLLSGTIRHTFDDIISSAWGSKDLIAMPRGGVLPEDDLATIQRTAGVRDAAAMVGATVVRLGADGRSIHGAAGRINVAGYDPAGPAPYDFDWVAGHPPTNRAEITLERNWARDRGLHVGDTLAVGTPTGRKRLPIVGIFKFSNGLNFGGEGLAAMALTPARALLGVPTGWNQISVRAKDRGAVAALRDTLQRRLGAGVNVETPAGLGDDIKSQLGALNVVLYFFAGVALFVGGFLILNSFSMTVAQRIRELGMLRTLGATRRDIRRSVMIEATLLGVIGSALGLALGLGLAAGLIVLIRGFGMPVSGLQISAGSAAIAALLGLLATAAGAWWPSRRASRVAPIRAAREGATARSRTSWQRIAIGAALYVPGAIWGGRFWFGSGSSGGGADAAFGIALTMAMFVGMALTAPAIITPLIRLLAAPLRRLAPTGGRLAADAVRRNPTRTASTAIALTIGLSVVIVNSALSASFVNSVNDRIERTYARDLTIQPIGATGAQGGSRAVGAAARRAIAALPDAGVVSPMRMTVAELPGLPKASKYGLVEGVDPATIGAVDRARADGISDADAPAALARGEALVARGYARLRHLHIGDRVMLSGPGGTERLRVAGIIDVFNAFGGNTVRVSTATLSRIFGESADSQLLVTARNPERREALTQEVDQLLAAKFPQLESLSTAEVKHDIEQQINQQFALFNAILAIAVLVSLLGVVNTLAMSVVERTREIGVLRALGTTRRLVRMTMVHEGVLITLAGAVAGLALGSVIAFCWVQSLDALLPGIAFTLPLTLVAGVAAGAVLLGTLAASLPARRAARLDVVDALAYE